MHTRRVNRAHGWAAAAVCLTLAVPPAAASAAPFPLGGGVCAGRAGHVCIRSDDTSSLPGKPARPQKKAPVKAGKTDPKAPVCTSVPMQPQPPAGSAERGGVTGTVYQLECADPIDNAATTINFVGGGGGGAAAPAVDPVVLARQAVDQMLLEGPKIQTAPKKGATGLVGLPVWLWSTVSPTTTGPNTATATAGAVTVSATAKVTSIQWSTGDGGSVTCAGPGTPYSVAYGRKPSPTCGHTYTRTSGKQPGAAYALAATSTWVVDWQVQGTALGGQLTETRTAVPQQVAIGEAQALGS
jgi:hypothetical protein